MRNNIIRLYIIYIICIYLQHNTINTNINKQLLSKLAKTRCTLPNNQHNIITMRSVGLRVIFILFIPLLIFFSRRIDRQHPDRRCSSCRCIICSQTIRLIRAGVAQPRRSEIVLHHTVCVGTITRP